MNLCIFFEGTGQGVAGKITSVTRLRDLCADDARQKLHLEPGLGTHFGSYLAGKIAGVDWRMTLFHEKISPWIGPEAFFKGAEPEGVLDGAGRRAFLRGARPPREDVRRPCLHRRMGRLEEVGR